MKKNKKVCKIFLSMLILITLCAASGCGALSAKPSFTGTWKFASMSSGGETLTAANIGSMDVVIFEITKDGKAEMNLDGNKSTGTWTEKNGTITITDSESGMNDTGTLKDKDTLVIKNEDDTITLVRVGSEAEKKVAATIGSAPSVPDGSSEAAADGSSSEESSSRAASPAEPAPVSSDPTGSIPSDTSGESLTVEPAEIFNQNDVTVNITGFSAADYYGPALNIQIANNSAEDITLQVSDSSVNGYMITDQLWEDVAAGKKANAQIYMPSAYLKDAGIDTVAEMEFKLNLINSADYSTTYTSDTISVKTSAYGNYVQKDRNDGQEVYNANGIRIVSLGYGTDAFMSKVIRLYAENNSDKKIEISVGKTSVDDVMVDTTAYIDLLPGKKAVSGISFMDPLTDPKSFEGVFYIEDMNTYETIGESDHITISMK